MNTAGLEKIQLDRFKGCLLGLAVGDAVGTTLEFVPKHKVRRINDMVGGGPFQLEPGQWTDDTSMALCLAASLLDKKELDPLDQLGRYSRWYRKGYMSSTGTCFDIGNTTATAIRLYEETGVPSGCIDAWSSGNGSIMRLAPVPMFFYSDTGLAIRKSGESSVTTHATKECIDACRILGNILVKALRGSCDEWDVLMGNPVTAENPRLTAISNGCYKTAPESSIHGNGYVVDSLEAALWSFWHSGSFEEAILYAANLGDDADTTAAICGQVAGAFYGMSGIPKKWLDKLHDKAMIEQMAEDLYKAAISRSNKTINEIRLI